MDRERRVKALPAGAAEANMVIYGIE